MDTKNKPTGKSIAAATILGFMAAAFVGSAINSIPPGQDWPQWVIWLLVAGGILVFTALLILIPVTWWKRNWYTVHRFCRLFGETIYWRIYGPKWTFDKPTISSSVLDDGYLHYTAYIGLHIQTKSKPLKINLSPAKICLEQRTEWNQGIIPYSLETHKGIPEIHHKARRKRYYKVKVYLDPKITLNIQRDNLLGIQGIHIALPVGLEKELHEGIYRKTPRQHHIAGGW